MTACDGTGADRDVVMESALKGVARGIFSLAGTLSGIACLGTLSHQLKIDRWLTVVSEPLSLAIRDLGTTELVNSRQGYRNAVEFHYTVDGKEYLGRELSPWMMAASHTMSFILCKRLDSVRTNGRQVQVIYDPAKPSRTFLMRSGSLGKIVTIAFTVVMFAVVLRLFAYIARRLPLRTRFHGRRSRARLLRRGGVALR